MEHNRQKTLRHRRHDDDDPSAAAAAAAGGGSDNDNNDNNDDENDVRRDDGGRGGMSLLDDVECKFNVNSYRMVFVINTESFLYRRNSLTTARQVSLVWHKLFQTTLSEFPSHFVSRSTLCHVQRRRW